MRTGLILALLAATAFAGCISDSEPTPDETTPETSTSAQAVVAVIDSGVNVYHDFYQTGTSLSDEQLATFVNTLDGQAPRRIQLTQQGSYEERLAADEPIWANITAGELVYFEGTNVLGMSPLASDAHPILDDGSHGTGTTTSVLTANPNAIVVLVEGVGSSAGEQWAATQPWIDILSESYGLYCGQPVLELVPGDSTASNNKLAADNGKLVVGAADNTPCPANNDGTAGPPWVVGVAGDHPDGEQECREPLSGNFPDFVADFTQTLSVAGTINETRSMSGTSFSTPTTAGTFSAILQEVRAAWGHEGGPVDGALAIGPDGQVLGAYDLREAMNRTATYFDFAVCSDPTGVPITPEGPWIQMGWGHVGPLVVEPAVEFLLGTANPEKPAEAVTYMETHYEYRKQIWGAVI